MLKKTTLIILFVVIVCSLSSQTLIHSYFKDYKEITRIVFVFDKSALFKINMDSDRQRIDIEIEKCKIIDSILPAMINEDNELIKRVIFQEFVNKTNITIEMKQSCYSEVFTIDREKFKLVLDVYMQEDPKSLESAHIYLDFWEKVMMNKRAKAMRKRIEKGEFEPSPDSFKVKKEKPQIEKAIELNLPKISKSDDLFKLAMPAISSEHINYRWIKDSFEIFEDLKDIMLNNYEQAWLKLHDYNESEKVDISFLEDISMQHNAISKQPTLINACKVRADKQIYTAPSSGNPEVVYTLNMLNSLNAYIPEFQNNMQKLISEYQKALNK